MKITKLLETVQSLFSSIMSILVLTTCISLGDSSHFFESIHCFHIEHFESLKKTHDAFSERSTFL